MGAATSTVSGFNTICANQPVRLTGKEADGHTPYDHTITCQQFVTCLNKSQFTYDYASNKIIPDNVQQKSNLDSTKVEMDKFVGCVKGIHSTDAQATIQAQQAQIHALQAQLAAAQK
mmetsp:Transcript_6980/g.9289  ORF Transcript_6980/g.9289 Transcript_6980/m.9289 type:complete len:117 (-) Transcript_6980:792-1142(-)